MNIKIIGGNGFIGSHLPYPKISKKLTLDRATIQTIMAEEGNPDVVINCAGFCGGNGKNIDQCEIEKPKTYETNTLIPILLAEWCVSHGSYLINLSSGCIFCGPSPHVYCDICKKKITNKRHTCEVIYPYRQPVDSGWRETDAANPSSYYAQTKYACDLVISALPNVATLRLRMPISSKDHPRNFINKIRQYKQLIDIPNSVTFTDDLVRCIQWCIDNHKTGIYNVTNTESLSAADVMRQYQKYFPTHQFSLINEDQLGQLTTAKRSNCLLDNSKLLSEGFVMTNSKRALENCMRQFVENIEPIL